MHLSVICFMIIYPVKKINNIRIGQRCKIYDLPAEPKR